MNTNNPDILFFVRREYGAPSIELRAYKVEKVSLHHEYGKNNCLYNSANNIPDLMKDMKRWQLSPIDRRNYERFRKVALGIYRQAGIIDFTTLETTPIKNV